MFGQTCCEYSLNFYLLESGPIRLGVAEEHVIIYVEDSQIQAITASSY